MPNCGNKFSIGDDHGDNSSTFTCQLPEGHDGEHQEWTEWENSGTVFTMTWNQGDDVIEAIEDKADREERAQRVPLGWVDDEPDGSAYVDMTRVYTAEFANDANVYSVSGGKVWWSFSYTRGANDTFFERGTTLDKTPKEVMSMVDDMARAHGLLKEDGR